MAMLVQKQLLTLMAPRPPPHPLPPNYRENEYCAYHQGRGHTTDRCYTLKNAIQDLIDDRKIVISVPGTPAAASTNILQNPLPQHSTDPSSSRGPAVNSIEKGDHIDRFFSPIQSIHAYTYEPTNPPPILQGANPFPPSVSEPVVLEGALPYDVPIVQGAPYSHSC